MNDHVTRIDQYPVTIGHAFDLTTAISRGFKIPQEMVRHGAHMPLGAARSHHHVIGDGCFAGQFDCDDVFRLIAIEGNLNGRK